jgi:oligopeptide transport system substrate-binding protein
MLPHNTMLPLPSHVVEEHGTAWTRPGNYVGNGAYTLVDWVPNDHITLEKNPLFFDAENVSVDRVVFYPTQDYDAALRRFRAGELDTQLRLPAASIDFIRQNMAENLNQAPQFTVEFIALNQSVPPLDDVRVRRALNLGLNRELLTDTVRRVGEVPAYSLVPPGIANNTHEPALDFKDTPYPERIAEAQALMREAGFGPENPLTLELAVRATSADARRVPAAMQEMWREIYVNLEIAQMDTAIFYSRADEHDFEIAQAAWGADFNDAINFLDLLRTGNGQNYGLYSNPEYDALLDRALNELDIDARAEILAQAETIALEDAAWVPVLFWMNTNLVQTYVSGWNANPQDEHRSRWVSIDTEARAAMFPNIYQN